MRKLALLALALTAAGAPSGKRVDRWKAPANHERLVLKWHELSETTKGARAPWPFLLYVTGVPDKLSAKIEKDIFTNTSFVLAARLCKPVRITPDEAVELPYLKSMPRMPDPMLAVVRRDRTLCGVLEKKAQLTYQRCLALMEQAVDAEYEITQRQFGAGHVKVLERAEQLWREEQRLASLAKKAAKKSGADKEEADAELKQRREALESARHALRLQERRLRDAARLKGAAVAAKAEPKPEADRDLTSKERAAIRTYRKNAKVENPVQRAVALQALSRLDSGAVARYLFGRVSLGDSWTVWQASRLLARMRSRGAREALHAILEKGGTREQTAALLALAEHRDRDALPGILACRKSKDPRVRAAAVRALGAQEGPQVPAALGSALADKSPDVRLLAARGIARGGHFDAIPGLKKLLRDPDWSVRKAAIEALGRLRSRPVLEPLMDSFGREEGLLHETCHDTLVRTTGQTFGYDLAQWQAWWKQSAAGFALPAPKDAEEALEEVQEIVRQNDPGWPVTYGSIGTFSRRIVFLIDIGPSMADLAYQKAKTKLDVAKETLIATLKGLEDPLTFNVMAYSDGVDRWRRKLARASYRKGAIQFVRKLRVVRPPGERRGPVIQRRLDQEAGESGGTRRSTAFSDGQEHERNLFGALLTALDVFDMEPLRDRRRPSADTVFLLIDGQPTSGQVRGIHRIVEILGEVNRTRGVVVHVTWFEESVGHLYEALAESTGGRCARHP
jgi:HEAT repeat protein